MAGRTGIDLEERARERLPERLRRPLDRADERIAGFLAGYGLAFLRIALGIVFVWFGALKIVGRSPVEDLVADTVPWLDRGFVVPFIGVWEVLVGLGLLVPIALRLTLLLFWLQMAGTFLVLVMHPRVAFQENNPLLLTQTGEFVIKNLVLISAGIAVGSLVHRRLLERGRTAAARGGAASRPRNQE